jgi:hypothetical protein
MVIVDPLVIITLLVTSLALGSAGAGGFLSLVLHLMSRSTVHVAQVADHPAA